MSLTATTFLPSSCFTTVTRPVSAIAAVATIASTASFRRCRRQCCAAAADESHKNPRLLPQAAADCVLRRGRRGRRRQQDGRQPAGAIENHLPGAGAWQCLVHGRGTGPGQDVEGGGLERSHEVCTHLSAPHARQSWCNARWTSYNYPMCCPCAANVLPMCCQCAAHVVLPMCCQCAAHVLPVCCPCAANVLPMCCQCAATAHVLPGDEGGDCRGKLMRPCFRGNGTNCIRIVPYSAVQFSSYTVYKKVGLSAGSPRAT